MFKATREDGREVTMHPMAKGVLFFGGMLALAVTVVFFVGLGGLLATL